MTQNEKKRIVLTGGGTGGHIFPLVAVAETLQQHYPDCEFLYIGTKAQMGEIAQEAMTRMHIPTVNVATGKMRRYYSGQYFLDFFRIPFGIVQCLWHLLRFMPDAVFSKGGYAAVPVVIAAGIYRIPVLTHESDAMPGWANRVCGKLSRYIAVSYEESKRYFQAERTVLTGNPIRHVIMQGDRIRGYGRWGLTESQPIVLVVGGSQGARAINEAVVRALPQLTHMAQILHITGKEQHEKTVRMAAEHGFKSGRDKYMAVPFLAFEEMADAYAVADIVISRAGANSITEIAANRKVVILVPLPTSANNHQVMNAYDVAKMGGAVVLEESNLGTGMLAEKVMTLLQDRDVRVKMQERIGAFYHPDAAGMIAAGVIKMIEE